MDKKKIFFFFGVLNTKTEIKEKKLPVYFKYIEAQKIQKY